jgi:hypothetical protein
MAARSSYTACIAKREEMTARPAPNDHDRRTGRPVSAIVSPGTNGFSGLVVPGLWGLTLLIVRLSFIAPPGNWANKVLDSFFWIPGMWTKGPGCDGSDPRDRPDGE